MLRKIFDFIVPAYLALSDWVAKKRGQPPFDKVKERLPIRFDFIFKNARFPDLSLIPALGEVCDDDILEHGPYPAHTVGYSATKKYREIRTIHMKQAIVDLDQLMRIVHKETNDPSEYIPTHMQGFAIPDGIDAFVNGVRITWVTPIAPKETQ